MHTHPRTHTHTFTCSRVRTIRLNAAKLTSRKRVEWDIEMSSSSILITTDKTEGRKKFLRPKLLYIIYTVFSTNLLYTGYKMLVLWLKHPDEMHRKHYTCRVLSVRIFSKSNGTGRANKASKVGEWERKYCLSLSLQWNRAVEKHKPRERTISMHREQKRAKRGKKN